MLKTEGFALPTVIVASLIMLTVLITSVTAVSSITTTLAGQYYNQLAREAAESGLAVARLCLRANNYVAAWSVPLQPNMYCNGTTNGAFPSYTLNSGNIRASFNVPVPPPAGVGGTMRITSTGTVQLVRASNASQVWRTYTYVAAENIRYNDLPQIAGGAGWENNGHNGYMLAASGVLYGWGDNTGQQLGDTSLGTTVSLPVKIAFPSGVTRAKKIFNSGQGASILCILATHDTLGDQLYCRGIPGAGENGLMPMTPGWYRFGLSGGLTATANVDINGYGPDSACVVASDNQAYCAGFNVSGFLGNAITNEAVVPITAPTKFRLDLANPGPISGSAASLTAKKVFTQDRFTCVIASDDKPYCAGDNNYGNLGQGGYTVDAGIGKSTPGRMLVPNALIITDIRLPYHNGLMEGVYAQASNGDMYMSGHSYFGTTNGSDGNDNPSPYDPCPGVPSVRCYKIPGFIGQAVGKMISVGDHDESNSNYNASAICAVITTSILPQPGLFCMGINRRGQFGTGSCANDQVKWFYNLSAYFGGETVSYAMGNEANYQMGSIMVVTTAGNAYTAGDNRYGKLGRNAPLNDCSPTFGKVTLPGGAKALAIANGDQYTAYILGDDGKVYAMGRNNNGQLGNGTTNNSNVPVEVQIPRQETIY